MNSNPRTMAIGLIVLLVLTLLSCVSLIIVCILYIDEKNEICDCNDNDTTNIPGKVLMDNKPVENEPRAPNDTIENEDIPIGNQETQIIENMWVDVHNRIRNDVGQKKVTWDENIAKGAQEYANKCVYEHSAAESRKYNGIILGENLAFGKPYAEYSDNDIMKLWEDEKQHYKYPQKPSESTSGETGHYTQIINKNVTSIGCGCSNCDDSKFCVCRYNPIQMGNESPY